MGHLGRLRIAVLAVLVLGVLAGPAQAATTLQSYGGKIYVIGDDTGATLTVSGTRASGFSFSGTDQLQADAGSGCTASGTTAQCPGSIWGLYIVARGGDDTIDLSMLGSVYGFFDTTVLGGAGNDVLDGSGDPDSINGDGSGTNGDDTIRGNGGDDYLRGDGSYSASGQDQIDGGAGRDRIWGDGGDGGGTDVILAADREADYLIDCMGGDDAAVVEPWDGSVVNCEAAAPPAACGDGKDNDGDGKTDFPADRDCVTYSDSYETADITPPCPSGEVGMPPSCVDDDPPDPPDAPESVTDASGQCTSPEARVAEGYAGPAFVHLAAQQNATETWVCFRVDQPSGGSLGGRFTVADPAGSAAVPVFDTSSGACTSSAENQLLGPHPILARSVEGTALMVDAYAAAHEAWICLQAGSQSHRVKVSVPGVSAPKVTSELDGPATVNPPAVVGPTDYPSSSCQATAEDGNRVINSDVGATHVWLYKTQPTDSSVDLCLRAEGGDLDHGGKLTVDTGSVDVTPSVTVHDDLDGCDPSTGVPAEGPVQLLRSDPPGLPASVCVSGPDTTKRVTVSVTGSAITPTVTWRPDPETPVPDIG